jgi:predicted MFS family arabinose efflux permease
MSNLPRITVSAVFDGLNDRTILALGLTQTIGYGTLYYAYGVLAPAISREFGVGIDWFFGAFTIGLLVGGLIAPFVGRELDRRGARLVMSLGSVLAALALVACALAPNIWAFSAAVILAEAATCLVVYEAAFAGLTQIYRHEARRGITLITLIAGFASTIFWPLTQWMLGAIDWRWTLLVFAAVHLLVCAPLHATALRRAVPQARDETREVPGATDPPMLLGRDRRRALILFTLAIVVSGLVTSAFPVHMLRIIENEGFNAQAAALIAMVMGPAQVLARFVEVVGGHRFDPLMTGRVALGTLLASIALLLAMPASLATAVAFAALYGAAQGLVTIARATVPLQLFGANGYGALMGRITGLRFLANAASPFLFAFAMTQLGIDTALWISGVIAALAFGLFVMLRAPPKS